MVKKPIYCGPRFISAGRRRPTKHPYRDAAKHTFECGCADPKVISRTRLAYLDFTYWELFSEGDIQKVFRCRNCQKVECFIEYNQKGTTNQ